ILRFDEKDNFWEMGDAGPCGPCSEIHIDLTKDGCNTEDINSGNPEVIELWNLVFIQYNRDEKGNLHDLPKKHIDTGMGFERVVRILQNKNSNYETDIFLPLINELIQITGKDYRGDKYISSMNVIADHTRALTFAIGDGAIPSNEGRGYVLRRILRRAARYGRNLDMHKPFIYNLVDVLVKTMGSVFPEIADKQKFIKEVVKGEEEGFNETLDRGLVYFNEEIEKMEKTGGKVFSGEVAFKLHDTYGFPIDLTQLMGREKGYEVDVDKFEVLMNEQKERSRRSYKMTAETGTFKLTGKDVDLVYNPYDVDEGSIKTQIIHLHQGIGAGKSVCFLRRNPFYAESGGQVSDIGKIVLEDGKELAVFDSKDKYVVVSPFDFAIEENTPVIVCIDYPRRQSIQRNHSATHLVHEALH
ncbi:MAG: alanine--tRNA ligase-related protein, partial [Ignavibacteria bacterium]